MLFCYLGSYLSIARYRFWSGLCLPWKGTRIKRYWNSGATGVVVRKLVKFASWLLLLALIGFKESDLNCLSVNSKIWLSWPSTVGQSQKGRQRINGNARVAKTVDYLYSGKNPYLVTGSSIDLSNSAYFSGSRGGCFTYTASGNKRYVAPFLLWAVTRAVFLAWMVHTLCEAW